MKIESEDIRRLRNLSRRERIRLLQHLEVSPAGAGRANSDDEVERLMEVAWREFRFHQRLGIFPPGEALSVLAGRRERSATGLPASRVFLRGPLLGLAAAALVSVTLWLGLPALIQDDRVLTTVSPVLPLRPVRGYETIFGPTLMEGAAGSIQMHRGIGVIVGSDRSPGAVDIVTPYFLADLHFHAPVDIRLIHTLGDLRVTGTNFSVDYRPGYGSFTLHEGSVDFLHRLPDGRTRRASFSAPAQVAFDAAALRGRKLVPAGSPEARRLSDSATLMIWQSFELRDGSREVGRVIQGDGATLTIETRSGRRITLDKRDILRTKVLEE